MRKRTIHTNGSPFISNCSTVHFIFQICLLLNSGSKRRSPKSKGQESFLF